MSEPRPVDENGGGKPSRRSVVGKVAHAIEHQLPPGDVAELRRVTPDDPYTPALWKLLLHHVPESWTGGPGRDENERRWAALFAGMAVAAGLHDPAVPLGRALAEAGWSELRFVRLMRDRADGLADRVRRVAAYLNSKAQTADWADVANLLLEQEGEWAERHRRRIARDYYRALQRLERTE
ncbi:MAG: type I-E CRISPR-associated protein Cse2/CasB [Planctomycetota bacterium]